MTRGRTLPWLLAGGATLSILTATLLAAGAVRVSSLARDGKVWISFALADGYSAEVREAIRSGLPITFTYDIDMCRDVPFWPDRALASATIAVSVTYDNLTRRHSLSRSLDGRIDGTRVTEDEADVKRWLTAFEKLPLFETKGLEANTEYYVRVRARTQPRDASFFWPWDRGLVSSNASFTFIP